MRKKIQHIIVVITLSSSATYAQVGIGNANPALGAILDLTNPDKGLLLPALAVPPVPDTGMLYFDTTDYILRYNDGGLNYNGLSPWKFKYGVPPIASNDVYYDEDGNVGIGVTNPKVKLSIDGGTEADTMGNNGFVLIGDAAGYHLVIDDDEIMVKSDPSKLDTLKLQEGGGTVQVGDMTIAPYTVNEYRTNLNVVGEVQQHGFALVPKGGIIMWHGATAPSGWALCNGQPITYLDGSTDTAPDLSGRFIVGYKTTSSATPVTVTTGKEENYGAIGNKGGETTHTLSETEMPDHTHTLNIATGGSHQHDALIDSGGGGSYGTNPGPGTSMWTDDDAGSGMSGGNPVANGILPTTFDGSHNHAGSSNGYTGGDTAHENRPPYFVLAFIIKL